MVDLLFTERTRFIVENAEEGFVCAGSTIYCRLIEKTICAFFYRTLRSAVIFSSDLIV